MLSRERKQIARLLVSRDEHGPDDWRYADALVVLREARGECEKQLGVTSADQ